MTDSSSSSSSSENIPKECIICAEKTNKTVHKNIRCMYCSFDSCRKCCERYILQETATTCMNPKCNKEWTRKFLRDNFTLKFINSEYKEKKENQLFELEKSMLPNAQLIVENIKRSLKVQTEIDELTELILTLNHQIALKKGLKIRLLNPEFAGQELNEEDDDIGSTRKNKNETDSRKFIKKCPFSNCRGYVDSKWKCNLCENLICTDCHEVKGKKADCEHTCNPDTVSSVALIKKDSRPCPNCSSMIYKIIGCDQMFCTKCKTGFSWNTGKIVNGSIHNPHYFEYINRRDGSVPRNPADVIPCGEGGGLIGERRLTESFDRSIVQKIRQLGTTSAKKGTMNEKNSLLLYCVQETIRGLREINDFHLILNRTDVLIDNRDLRIQYLSESITESEFKAALQMREKKQEKMREMYNIFNMCLVVGNDIFIRFLDSNDVNIFREFDKLIEYANDCINDVCRTYSSSTKFRFSPQFRYLTNWKDNVLGFAEILAIPAPDQEPVKSGNIDSNNMTNIYTIVKNQRKPKDRLNIFEK